MRNTSEATGQDAPAKAPAPTKVHASAKAPTSRAARRPGDEARQQAEEVAAVLAELYPDAHCELRHRNPFELLVATVLSAQTTDARVNTVTPALFAAFPDAASLAVADEDVVASLVRPLGFQRRRSAQLCALARQLVADHEGRVPDSRAGLEALPGVGRKTAHVVLGNAFGHSAITVDTHVGRLARRLGWSSAKTPLAVERDLAALLEVVNWTVLCHRLIWHGRQICQARTPKCSECALARLCPSATVAA